jgi:hypothetical protein
MIEKYILTSPSFKGNAVFGFSGGFLSYFENESEMNEEQLRWLYGHFPFTLENLVAIQSKIKGRLEQVPTDLGFDVFWDSYDKKVNRKRCEPLWKKLTDAERITCLRSIAAYNSYLKRVGFRAKMDPENYLKREAFSNPWNSLTS